MQLERLSAQVPIDAVQHVAAAARGVRGRDSSGHVDAQPRGLRAQPEPLRAVHDDELARVARKQPPRQEGVRLRRREPADVDSLDTDSSRDPVALALVVRVDARRPAGKREQDQHRDRDQKSPSPRAPAARPSLDQHVHRPKSRRSAAKSHCRGIRQASAGLRSRRGRGASRPRRGPRPRARQRSTCRTRPCRNGRGRRG